MGKQTATEVGNKIAVTGFEFLPKGICRLLLLEISIDLIPGVL